MWYGQDVPAFKPKYTFKYYREATLEDRERAIFDLLPKTNFICAYYSYPDRLAHRYGPFSKETLDSVKKVDESIGRIVRHLEASISYADIIVVSDHGMAEVNAKREINLSSLTDISNFQMYGASPVWNIWPQKGLENKVYETLSELSKTHHFRVWKRKDIPKEYHYR